MRWPTTRMSRPPHNFGHEWPAITARSYTCLPGVWLPKSGTRGDPPGAATTPLPETKRGRQTRGRNPGGDQIPWVQPTGFEPASPAFQAGILPLNYGPLNAASSAALVG